MALDEQRKPAPPEASEHSDPVVDPPDPREIVGLLRQLSRGASPKERAELDRLVAQTQPLMAYLERKEEIEAASAALEAHREEFNRLTRDGDAFQARVHALFAEDRFAPLWFTAADIRRAFDAVGYPPNFSPDDRTVETLRAAILHLADKDRRSKLAMSLLLHLPDFVTAGRHLEGWLIQQSTYDTGELTQDSNPFLFEMFAHGYDAWAAEQNARGGDLVRSLGMDPARLRGMTLEEIEAWLQAQETDPRQRARMEAMMEAHPDQRAVAIAGLEKAERDFVTLLEREDARGFLLPQDEVEPWLPILLERFEKARESCPDLSGDAQPDEAASRAFAEAIWPAFGELAQGIFTPERVRQLVSQLRQYRNEQFAAGDHAAAAAVMSAVNSLDYEKVPARNYFLNALCFVSLRSLAPSAADPSPADEDAEPPGEPAG